MDSQTHIEFAQRLLAIAQCPGAYAIASLFPQIDRYPHVFHRMYAHTVFKAHRLTQTGLRVLADAHFIDVAHAFDVRRFREEQPRFEDYLRAQRWRLPAFGTNAGHAAHAVAAAHGCDAALLAYVSHLYLDTFNQPTQPFAPLSIYCAGQWALWEKIGDFRLTLYTTPVIDRLRRELFADALWRQADAFASTVQIEAMLQRLCAHSLGHISNSIVVPALDAMRLEPSHPHAVARCCDFLANFEAVLSDLHVRHLAASEPLCNADAAAIGRAHERVAALSN
jgi:hypothetical protein